jgi:hypothetical protein
MEISFGGNQAALMQDLARPRDKTGGRWRFERETHDERSAGRSIGQRTSRGVIGREGTNGSDKPQACRE